MAPRSLSLSPFVVLLAALVWLCSGVPRTPAAQEDPASLVRAYWEASDPAARAPIAGRISAHPDYRPARLREWLQAGVPFADLRAGTRTITVDAGAEGQRPVTLVLPEGYRSDRAWPLVYALHPSGEPAERWAAQVQRLLRERAREFVIASPEYRQNYIAVRPPLAVFGLDIGFTFDLGDHFFVGLDSGLRYQTAPSPFAVSPAPTGMNDSDGKWSAPVAATVGVRF